MLQSILNAPKNYAQFKLWTLICVVPWYKTFVSQFNSKDWTRSSNLNTMTLPTISDFEIRIQIWLKLFKLQSLYFWTNNTLVCNKQHNMRQYCNKILKIQLKLNTMPPHPPLLKCQQNQQAMQLQYTKNTFLCQNFDPFKDNYCSIRWWLWSTVLN